MDSMQKWIGRSLGTLFRHISIIRLKPGMSAQTFQTAALTLSGILSMTSMTGALDFRLRVACRDQSDLVGLIEKLRSKAGVQETNTSIILGRDHSMGLKICPPSGRQPASTGRRRMQVACACFPVRCHGFSFAVMSTCRVGVHRCAQSGQVCQYTVAQELQRQ